MSNISPSHVVMLWFEITADVVERTVKIETSTVEIEERGVKLRLTVVDTPGYGDGMDNKDRSVSFLKKWFRLIVKQGTQVFQRWALKLLYGTKII